MIRLELHELSWVDGPTDDPADQCAHGCVLFEVNGVRFVSLDDGAWTVSAAGLFLLRTLETDHKRAHDLTDGNLLFPCCGHSVFPMDDSRHGFVCMGCPNGVHVDVEHREGNVTLRSRSGTADVASGNWDAAVQQFCDQVQSFYDAASPKVEQDSSDQEGWDLFWAEWRRRTVRTQYAPCE